ncbi:Atu1372/SO_1960 family protein [Flavobacterium sp. JP2137]|uniref:Atu1372/SO_1960 family protein n=1 Tax=Flavobacterium sp. JP2137 TaxID=3414510 RepID=UPI003D2FF67D
MKQLKIALIALSILPCLTSVAQEKKQILVLFHSEQSTTYKLARALAEGIDKNPRAQAVLKRIETATNTEKNSDIPLAIIDDLTQYDGIAFGSPVHFGNMSGAMRSFLDQSVKIWTDRALEGIPATVFMGAGSGAGNEAAILSFWSSLAVHGMILVPTGIMAMDGMDKNTAQGNTVFGTTSLASMPAPERPTASELNAARLQGEALARVAVALAVESPKKKAVSASKPQRISIESRLSELQITLPDTPAPAGSYVPYVRTGNLVYINQVALKDGKILYPGIIEKDLTVAQAKEATRQTMLNVIAVLKDATQGDLNRVKQCVQLTGFFNTAAGYTQHAGLMNSASDLLIEVFGNRGKHTRATVGASSIPVNSAVEIQAVFEIE